MDFHTQEHDPAAKDCREDSQKLQEAVAQIFNVNGETDTSRHACLSYHLLRLDFLWLIGEECALQ